MRTTALAAFLGLAGLASAAQAAPPTYTIVDLGIVNPADVASQAFGISAGGVCTGRSFGNPTQAFSWTQSGGLVGLPNLASPSRPFSAGNGANDAGDVVGTGATTSFGSSPLPLLWHNGVVSQLPLPAGSTLGRANDVNASATAVGSVGSGSTEFGVIYSGGSAAVITTTGPGGIFFRVAFGINDAGLIAGQGIDPGNAARNVGILYDQNTNVVSEVGALPGLNGALCFGISNGGHVVGSSMLNQGSGLPFIWTAGGGIQPIPLPVGTSQGSARGANSAGWAVGTASSAFAIPFLFDGSATYRLEDLLPPASGWDLATNTSSSAMGISDDGIITGTGIHNGQTRAYAMIPDTTVPVALEQFTATGHADGIELQWRLQEAHEALRVDVERASDAAGPWSRIAPETAQHNGLTVAFDRDVQPGEIAYYRLAVAETSGRTVLLGLVSAGRTAAAVLRTGLGAPVPNPARTGTAVAMRLPAAGNVQLTVHDVRGRIVRTLLDGAAAAGERSVFWDGRTDAGGDAPAGVYFVRLQTAQAHATQRVTLVR